MVNDYDVHTDSATVLVQGGPKMGADMGFDMNRRSFLQAVPGGLLVATSVAAGAGTVGTALLGASGASAAVPAGTLSVPKLKLNKSIYAGIENDALDIGVGHGLWSARPGTSGHCMLFGHRTSKGGPFRNLHKLRRGDAIVAGGTTYKVRKIEVISINFKQRIWTYDGTGKRISLVACSTASGMPTSLKYRICIRASA